MEKGINENKSKVKNMHAYSLRIYENVQINTDTACENIDYVF